MILFIILELVFVEKKNEQNACEKTPCIVVYCMNNVYIQIHLIYILS